VIGILPRAGDGQRSQHVVIGQRHAAVCEELAVRHLEKNSAVSEIELDQQARDELAAAA
jgi:hypothetical protein